MDSTLIIPFIDWLKANGLSRATGYRLINDGLLHITKVRRRTYITKNEAARFVDSLEKDTQPKERTHA